MTRIVDASMPREHQMAGWNEGQKSQGGNPAKRGGREGGREWGRGGGGGLGPPGVNRSIFGRSIGGGGGGAGWGGGFYCGGEIDFSGPPGGLEHR